MEVKIDERIERLFELVEEGKIDEFEFLRQRMICEHIDAIDDPDQKRRAIILQQKIEMERRNFKGSDYHFATYLFGRMWSSFLEMDQALVPFRSSGDDVKRSDHASGNKLDQLQSKVTHLKAIHRK